MTNMKKFIIICSTTVGVVLIAFFALMITYHVKLNYKGNDKWQSENLSTTSSIGELVVNYKDYANGRFVLDGNDMTFERGDEKGDGTRGYFSHDGTKYFMEVFISQDDTTGFLYSVNGTSVNFIEKLNFRVN